MSTFNGWPIIPAPSSPVAKSIEWGPDDVQGSNRSPFSLRRQIYDWQQSILRASVSFAPMSEAQALPWIVFLLALRGINGVFLFGDPRRTTPQNGGATAGTVTGSGQTGYELVTSSTNLTPGDWFSIGVRLYRVLTVSGGTLGIYPPIRESPVSGSDLVIVNPQGLFRLTKNQRKYSEKEGGIYGFTFEIEEAL